MIIDCRLPFHVDVKLIHVYIEFPVKCERFCSTEFACVFNIAGVIRFNDVTHNTTAIIVHADSILIAHPIRDTLISL